MAARRVCQAMFSMSAAALPSSYLQKYRASLVKRFSDFKSSLIISNGERPHGKLRHGMYIKRVRRNGDMAWRDDNAARRDDKLNIPYHRPSRAAENGFRMKQPPRHEERMRKLAGASSTVAETSGLLF